MAWNFDQSLKESRLRGRIKFLIQPLKKTEIIERHEKFDQNFARPRVCEWHLKFVYCLVKQGTLNFAQFTE